MCEALDNSTRPMTEEETRKIVLSPKGSTLFLEGRLQTRKWQDKDGKDRYTTEIISDHFQMLDKKPVPEG